MDIELFVRLSASNAMDGKDYIWAAHKVIDVADGTQKRRTKSGMRKVVVGWFQLECTYADGSIDQPWVGLKKDDFNCKRDNRGWH